MSFEFETKDDGTTEVNLITREEQDRIDEHNIVRAAEKLLPPTQIMLQRVEYPDSIDFDTPGKQGNLKVYFNASNLEEAKQRIKNARLARDYAKLEVLD